MNQELAVIVWHGLEGQHLGVECRRCGWTMLARELLPDEPPDYAAQRHLTVAHRIDGVGRELFVIHRLHPRLGGPVLTDARTRVVARREAMLTHSARGR